jgi:hypothetical protein
MSANKYRPVSARAKAINGEDDFEAEYTADEERDLLDGGHIEIVPRAYRILSDNYSAGAQDEVVELALSIDHEQMLTSGGHIERVEKAPAKKAAAKKK